MAPCNLILYGSSLLGYRRISSLSTYFPPSGLQLLLELAAPEPFFAKAGTAVKVKITGATYTAFLIISLRVILVMTTPRNVSLRLNRRYWRKPPPVLLLLPSAAKPQPNLGISLAKTQRPQRGTATTKSENRDSPQRTQSSQRFFISKSLSLSPPRLRGEFSISSQLANNFDDCSTE